MKNNGTSNLPTKDKPRTESKGSGTDRKIPKLDAKQYPFNILHTVDKDPHTREFYLRYGIVSELPESFK